MERGPEMLEALDLSMPKTKSADDKPSREPSTELPLSDDATSEDKLPAFRKSSVPAFSGRDLHRRRELEDDVGNYDLKNKDSEPPSKKYKMLPTPHKGDSPPAAFISRNADVSDACLRDDDDSPPSVPFHIENAQCAGEIKRTCCGVTVSLHDEKLWRAFAKFGTEMIINRSGRRMFPHIILSMDGLQPQMVYSVTLEIVPADQQRYKFIHHQWIPIGIADQVPGVQPVSHPDSPNVGSFWMRNRASFSKVRLTNNTESSLKESADGNILLLSMHKYKVVIKIKEESSPSKTELIFDFDESAFIAVTAYQNSKITQLKIQNNPFAKAFRDSKNPVATQKIVPSRRRDAKMKDGCPSQFTVPNAAVQTKDFPHYLPYQSMPFYHRGFSIATALEHLYRNNILTNASNQSQYFPWGTVGQHWPLQFLGRDQSLMDAMHSDMPSSKTSDMSFVHPPTNQNRRRWLSEASQTSSSDGYQYNEDSDEERKV